MKPKYYLPLAIGALALAATTSANAMAPEEIRVHKLKVSLEAVYEGEETDDQKDEDDKKYSYSSEFLKEKISNKEIVAALVAEEELGNPKGWSLVLVTDDDANIVGVFLTKKGQDNRNVSEYFDAESEGSIEEYKGKIDKSEGTNEFTFTDFGIATLGIDIDGFDIELIGTLEVEGEAVGYDEVGFIDTASFEDLTGGGENDGEDVVVTGEMSASSGKEADVDDFFDVR